MKKYFKVSGRMLALPDFNAFKDIKLHKRPGGWVICEVKGVRTRIMLVSKGTRISASFGGNLWHGEII